MTTYGRGLGFMRQYETAERSERMYKLWLRSGESATFWFINDASNMLEVLMHMQQRTSRTGKSYTVDVLCTRANPEEPRDKCALCMVDDESVKGPWSRLLTLVYVERISHLRRDKDTWVAKQGPDGTIFYVEEVNAPRLLIAKSWIHDEIYRMAHGGGSELDDLSVGEPVSLTDRLFVLRKTGTGAQTREEISALPTRPIPEAVTAARAEFAERLEEIAVADLGQKIAVADLGQKTRGGASREAPAFRSDGTPFKKEDIWDEFLGEGLASPSGNRAAIGDDELVSF